ncbi:MAG: hypothetical protein CMA12_01525 [Euryarchaeota archaeon]|nr:hypothetical protein [Euryarchaeota archaeon]OUW22920.1 MAG: hypothetical protein CBD33_00100 [Euryarchaeota archaeon TMED173]|tara:strand:- start:93 stop:587 length:495 start_codon:yes stop_codon:yes gene_type:complete
MEPKILVSTKIDPFEDPNLVIRSIKSIFPDWKPDFVPERFSFPSGTNSHKISGEVQTIDFLISILRQNRILDTAMDAMTIGASKNELSFSLSRQSASIGKASFVLNNEVPLGGSIRVSIIGDDVDIWVEQQTWHSGRDRIPRAVGDELSMSESGKATEWFGKDS